MRTINMKKVLSVVIAFVMALSLFVSVASVDAHAAKNQKSSVTKYSFNYAYDCKRDPSYPALGDEVELSTFVKPLDKNGNKDTQSTLASEGSWELIDSGKYDSAIHTEWKKAKISAIVKLIADKYGISSSSVTVYALKNNGEHVCYGVVAAVLEDGILFIGTTYNGGGGYYLSTKQLSKNSKVNTVAVGDAENMPNPADMPHNHTLAHAKANDPTCTDEGNVEYFYCTLCSAMFSDREGTEPLNDASIDALNHDMSEATCDEPAECQREGCDYVDEGSELGHDMSKATCKEPSTCQRKDCDHTEGTVLEHDWTGEWKVVKEATATEEGLKETYCVRGCGEKKEDKIPATGVENSPKTGDLNSMMAIMAAMLLAGATLVVVSKKRKEEN